MPTYANVTTGVVRACFVQIATPREDQSGNPKYSVMLLVPKTDKQTRAALDRAIDQVIEGDFKGKLPPRAKTPVRDPLEDLDDDGNPRTGEPWDGHVYLRANTKNPPAIVDAQGKPAVDREIVRSGDYVRAKLTATSYNVDGNRGVKFYLDAVQFIAKGDPIAAGRGDDFGAYTGDFVPPSSRADAWAS